MIHNDAVALVNRIMLDPLLVTLMDASRIAATHEVTALVSQNMPTRQLDYMDDPTEKQAQITQLKTRLRLPNSKTRIRLSNSKTIRRQYRECVYAYIISYHV